MNSELVDLLYTEFPDLFPDRNIPPSETGGRMRYGLECGDGWFDIIHCFCQLTSTKIHRVNRRNAEHSHALTRFTFRQIKKKFGTLRLYYDLHQPSPGEGEPERDTLWKLYHMDLEELIRGYQAFACHISGRTCERTGKPGRLLCCGGWYATLCPEEAEKEGYREISEADGGNAGWFPIGHARLSGRNNQS